jgi:hypothetical protein
MEKRAFGPCQPREFLDRIQDAGLIIRPHNGDHGGVVADRLLGGTEIKAAQGIDGQPGDFIAAASERRAIIFGGAMLDPSCDDMLAIPVRRQGAGDSGVVPLAAAARKDDLPRLRADQPRDLFPGMLDGPPGTGAEAVSTGRVAVKLRQVREHRFEDCGVQGGGGVVVEVKQRSGAGHGRKRF